MKNNNYPLCQQHKLLRTTQNNCQVVSTTALHDLLGEKLYQRAKDFFSYRHSSSAGPEPFHVEHFLRTDEEARRKLKQEDYRV